MKPGYAPSNLFKELQARLQAGFFLPFPCGIECCRGIIRRFPPAWRSLVTVLKVSVVIRTFNEARYLGELLAAIDSQETSHEVEVVLVDSGSTDETLEIASRHSAVVVEISQDEFTFGRSLNVGCEAATGEVLAFISGHCVPVDKSWVERMTQPLVDGHAAYSYGKQVGRDTTHYSESRVFEKYYPGNSMIPQEGFFCNNANAFLKKSLWSQFRFNEELTGLEDMYLAKQLSVAGHHVAYVADAPVFHIHDEGWKNIRIRYEREAIALREIMPEVHISPLDFVVWVVSSIVTDCRAALSEGKPGELPDIMLYRLNQYLGSYRGNHEHRKLSRDMKQKYFYPNKRMEKEK